MAEINSENHLTNTGKGAPKGNENSLKHGAFCSKLPLKRKYKTLLKNGIAYLSSLRGFKPQFLPLLQRIERIWVILLKLDAYEDEHPEILEPSHWKYKASYENSFRLHLSMLFNFIGHKQPADDWIKRITEAEDVK